MTVNKEMPLKYAVITAARNEEAFIELTIRSILKQTLLPERWIIVSDGSTDSTDSIVQRYLPGNDWLSFVRRPERTQRNFAAKADCVNLAYAMLKEFDFGVLANLDADVSFSSDYFEFLLNQFLVDPKLGVAGTPYVEGEASESQHSCSHRYADLKHVSGPCQLFKRQVFEAIGGYSPIKGGGVDWIAVRSARMLGWETRTFVGRTYRHHRKMGTAESGSLSSSFQYGKKAYRLGGYPAWELLRGFFRMRKWPWILDGLVFQLGFLFAFVSRTPRVVSPELLAFHQAEQKNRLRRIFWPWTRSNRR